MTEGQFKKRLESEIKKMFPDCIVLKNDPAFIQGIPDLLILYEDRWASLETKKSEDEPHRPNQDYYVQLMNKMSFSAFIYPENKKEILDDLWYFFMT